MITSAETKWNRARDFYFPHPTPNNTITLLGAKSAYNLLRTRAAISSQQRMRIVGAFFVMIKSFKYRIYPNQEQKQTLTIQFGCARFAYNWGLGEGGIVERIDRFYPSSKTCHVCGWVNHELKLHHRFWTCGECGTEHDRDENAAKNIECFPTAGIVGSYAGEEYKVLVEAGKPTPLSLDNSRTEDLGEDI